jgi:hypothetical protein
MQTTSAHLHFEFATDFVLYFGFQLYFLLSVVDIIVPLCITLPVMGSRQFASC